MLKNFLLSISLMLCLGSCQLVPFLKEVPFLIKAVIEGDIKNQPIRCEKLIDLIAGEWGDMCQATNDVQIKYRVKKISGDQAQLEFAVSKTKGERKKVIATPSLMVNNNVCSRDVATGKSCNLVVTAERIKR